MSFGKVRLDPADIAFSQWIRTRDNWTCQRCGMSYTPPTNSLQCSHFQGRRKEGTRFEPLNCDALCAGCHSYFGANPAEHYKWQVNRKGQRVVDQIVLQSNTYHKKDRKLELLYWKQRLIDEFGILI